jgi:hypothetical protein
LAPPKANGVIGMCIKGRLIFVVTDKFIKPFLFSDANPVQIKKSNSLKLLLKLLRIRMIRMGRSGGFLISIQKFPAF